MAKLIQFDRETWLDNWQTRVWPVVQILYDRLHHAENWITRDDVPGRCMAKVTPYQASTVWCVSFAISDPDVAFEFRMRFG